MIRAIGGLLFLFGSLLMAYNVWRTVRGDVPVDIADQPRSPPPPSCAPAPAE